jgi:hypothetical protein
MNQNLAWRTVPAARGRRPPGSDTSSLVLFLATAVNYGDRATLDQDRR